MVQTSTRRKFLLFLVKPSHYDDDGYVIQWVRSAIPSNSLAVLYGLAVDCAERQVLGDDVDIEIIAIDETNTRVRPSAIVEQIEQQRRLRHGGAGRRAVEPVPARAGHRAAAARGRRPGLHRRLPRLGLPGDAAGNAGGYARRRSDLGISLFAGEAEGRLEVVLQDAAAARCSRSTIS